MTPDDDSRRREFVGPFHAQPIWTDDGLVVGIGTRLLPLGKGALTSAAGDRLLAILSAASGQAMAEDILVHVEASQAQRVRGEPALAQIHLALAQLPRIDKAGAYRAFLADQALAGGMAPDALRAALGLSAANSACKFVAGQPRVPAGSGRASGQWTSSGSGDAGQKNADHGPLLHTIASADDPQGLKMAKAAAAAAGLDRAQRRQFHDAISGQDITVFQQLLEIARDIKAVADDGR